MRGALHAPWARRGRWQVTLGGAPEGAARKCRLFFLSVNATARLYLDRATTVDQRRELEAIFQGTKGGPIAVLGGLVAKWLPTQTTPIALHEEGETLTATVTWRVS